jgi:hypothetical protein
MDVMVNHALEVDESGTMTLVPLTASQCRIDELRVEKVVDQLRLYLHVVAAIILFQVCAYKLPWLHKDMELTLA